VKATGKTRTGVDAAQTSTCAAVIESLGAYHDGELAVNRRVTIEGHLNGCGKCSKYLKSYLATIRLAKQAMTESAGAPPIPIPEDVIESIVTAHRHRK
jgi:predicted anti-sigma-YlaC factor YlaD